MTAPLTRKVFAGIKPLSRYMSMSLNEEYCTNKCPNLLIAHRNSRAQELLRYMRASVRILVMAHCVNRVFEFGG